MPPAGSNPCFTIESFTSGDSSATRTCRFSVAIISAGTFAGATNPYQLLTSKPGMPASIMVGNSGTSAERFAVVTASARSLPLRMCCSDVLVVANMNCNWPDNKSMVAGAPPLYGMCTSLMPAMLASISPARCPDVPFCGEP